ncbi:MAG: Uma2 family endonuclease [Cyanobacteria bacterium J069]|nr:MAG: Uma2 family endonuclease [Cyanobacteria bacterium J069]
MTQAQAKFATFEEYLAYSDETAMEGRYELIDGELVELPPESEPNNWIANNLQFLLALAHLFPRRLIKTHSLELQVPVLQPKDAANRYPDLVVLRPEHLTLTQRRLTITLEMPPPRLVVEVVSPGKTNRDRDYVRKRAQYAVLGIPEYWLIDPEAQTVMVLSLEAGAYREIGVFGMGAAIASVEFPELAIAVDQLWDEESS